MLRHDFPSIRSLFALFVNGIIFLRLGLSELQNIKLSVELHQHSLYRILAWVAVRGLLHQRQQCMGTHFELLLHGAELPVRFGVMRPVPAKAWVGIPGQREPRLMQYMWVDRHVRRPLASFLLLLDGRHDAELKGKLMTEPKTLQIVTNEHDDHDNDDYDYDDDDDADDDDIMVGSRRNKRSSEHMLTPHYWHMS